jgi:hypothetical protein
VRCLAGAAAIAVSPAHSQGQAPEPPAVRKQPWRGTAAAPPGTDTLDVHSILEARSAALDSALQVETTTFDTLGLDSLVTAIDRGGAAAAADAERKRRRRARTLGFELRPGALWTYDRVNGMRLGSGVEVRAGRSIAVEASAARALAAERWAGDGRARVGGKRLWAAAGWADHAVPFGPNQGGHFTSLGALVAGQDRQEYLRRRRWTAGLELQPRARTQLGLRYFVDEDDSAPVETDFHFAGGDTPIERANPAVDAGTARGLELDGRWSTRHERVVVQAHAAIAGGDLGGDFEHSRQEGSLALASPIVAAGTWRLTLGGANVGGSPPVQAVPYLGGDGNLRGFAPLEFTGRRRATLRAEYALAHDLLAHTGIPIVRSLHLQFIPFADAGATWGAARGVAGSRALDGRWKSSFGLGVQRDLDYPGLGSLRLDVSRRTDGGPGGVGVWFRVLPLAID